MGGVTFEFNSREATTWIRGKSIMSDFIANMGSTTDYKEQTFEVVMDWVPVTLDIEQAKARRAIEQVSGLRNLVIKWVMWIKPIHLCTEGQWKERRSGEESRYKNQGDA